MNIALIAPTGSGKGTHSESLIEAYHLRRLSIGELLRENVENETPLGLRAKQAIGDGEMVDDDVIYTMIRSRVMEMPASQGLLVDGFPKSRGQAEWLESLFAETGRQLDAAVYLNISDEEAIRRLAGRQICGKCRRPFHKEDNPFQSCPTSECKGQHLYQLADDRPSLVLRRLRNFHRGSRGVLEHFRDQGKLHVINGDGPIVDVCAAIRRSIDDRMVASLTGVDMDRLQAIPALRPPKKPAPRRATGQTTRDLILVGPPGSGKGTQSEKLIKAFNLVHIATGDIFRDNIRRETELGQLAKTYIDRGELVPDDITEAMVTDRIIQPDSVGGFLLDGFPRSVPQAEALADFLEEIGRPMPGAIYISVPDEAIVTRLAGRSVCRKCRASFHKEFRPFEKCPSGQCESGEHLYRRDDDEPETVRKRLVTYHGLTAPLVDYFREANLLEEVRGHDAIEITAALVMKKASDLLGRQPITV